MHELDNPIWHALTTRQAAFAERDGDAGRFAPAVTALAAVQVESEPALTALARLFRPGEVSFLFSARPLALPTGLDAAETFEVVQMVHDGPVPPPSAPAPAIVELGTADRPQMIALAALTRPGYVASRTAELGVFLGIRAGDQLVAMAGQRMRLGPDGAGHHEVSAVCTHPDHLGRGLAAQLLTAQLALIGGAGDAAFLHVRSDNQRAIALYQRLGFHARRSFCCVTARGAATVA
jgi:ribosomal protein S18 acetylase RimI-like enzyme